MSTAPLYAIPGSVSAGETPATAPAVPGGEAMRPRTVAEVLAESQVEAVLCSERSVELPERSIDVAFLPALGATVARVLVAARKPQNLVFLGLLWLYSETGTLLFYDGGGTNRDRSPASRSWSVRARPSPWRRRRATWWCMPTR